MTHGVIDGMTRGWDHAAMAEVWIGVTLIVMTVALEGTLRGVIYGLTAGA